MMPKVTVKKCKLPRPKEVEIQRAILEWLKLNGIMAWRSNTGGAAFPNGRGGFQHVRFGFSGVSDIIGILRYPPFDLGRFLAIEVKRPGNKPTLDQEAFLEGIRSNGGMAFVATSVDDVREKLGF